MRYAALKATGDAELLRQTEMKHHPSCTPRPDARAAGVLAESWSSKDSTRGLSLQNCPPPPTHKQLQTVRLKPDASSEIRLTAESGIIIMLLNFFYLFFFLFPSLCCCFFFFSKKKKKKEQSSHFTLLSYFFFIFFLPFLVVKIWQKLGEDVTRYQGGKNSSPCWCCCTVCALANWATRCPAHSNSEVRN